MITNFEKITANLTEEEMAQLPMIVDILRNFDKKEKAIKSPELCRRISFVVNKKFNSVKLRKCISHIRKSGKLPVIATSNGYYVSYNHEEIGKEIKSLNERAAAIRQAADGMAYYLTNTL